MLLNHAKINYGGVLDQYNTVMFSGFLGVTFLTTSSRISFCFVLGK